MLLYLTKNMNKKKEKVQPIRTQDTFNQILHFGVHTRGSYIRESQNLLKLSVSNFYLHNIYK